jgi:hypothetical protein
MNFRSILVAGLVGTSIMTAFSYAVSKKRKKNFKEPELLSSLLQNWYPVFESKYADVAGWNFHYAMGEAWTIIYVLLLKTLHRKPSFYRSLLFGYFGGIVAVGTWKMLFKLNPNPPKILFREFYLQLVIAHLCFSTSMSKVYSTLKQ